jgi:hypothetical protein
MKCEAGRLVPPYYLGNVGTGVFGSDARADGCRDGAKKGAGEARAGEQLGALQERPRAPVRLSCCEIRRLFWQLCVVVERSAELVLRWSWWRRWHQAWARYYHYRRQERKLAQTVPPQHQEPTAAEQQEDEQLTDVLDVVWKRLEPLLPAEKRTGRPYEHPRRIVLEAIVYVMRTMT